MDLNMLIILGLCVVIVLMLIFIYVKDRQTDKKLDRFDQVISDVMQESFVIKKELHALKGEMGLIGDSENASAPKSNIDINAIADVIDETMEARLSGISQLVDKRVEEQIRPLLDQLKELVGTVKNG